MNKDVLLFLINLHIQNIVGTIPIVEVLIKLYHVYLFLLAVGLLCFY